MQVQVSGKHVDVGEALRSRIVDELSGQIGKFFDRGGAAEVVVTREGHMFRVDCLLTLASGQQIVSHAFGGDAHGAFDAVLDKVDRRVRRYKRRLKNHPTGAAKGDPEIASVTVLQAPDIYDDDEHEEADDLAHADGPPPAMVIAETEREIRTLTVSMAVLELDVTAYPVLLFRNAAHGGLSVVYRRPDGNIGWIDPERTRSGNGHVSSA